MHNIEKSKKKTKFPIKKEFEIRKCSIVLHRLNVKSMFCPYSALCSYVLYLIFFDVLVIQLSEIFLFHNINVLYYGLQNVGRFEKHCLII